MHNPYAEDGDFSAYSPDELHTMIQAASHLATVIERAHEKHGPYSGLTLSLRAAWAVLDEEIECNASEEEYAAYQDALSGEAIPVPNHPGTSTPQ
jgi:hypothetical protein